MKRSLVISMGDIAHSGSGFTHMHQLYIDVDEVDLTPFISVKGNSKAKVSGKPLCVIERKKVAMVAAGVIVLTPNTMWL